MIGAHLVAKYSMNDYASFVTSRIFEPLQMHNTTYYPSISKTQGNLSQSWTAHEQRIPFWYDDTAVEIMAGPGGIISNVVDLVQYSLSTFVLTLTMHRIGKLAANAPQWGIQSVHEPDNSTGICLRCSDDVTFIDERQVI